MSAAGAPFGYADLPQQSLFFDRVLIFLFKSFARTDEEINKNTRNKKDDQKQDTEDDHEGITCAGTDIPQYPKDQPDP